MKFASIGDVCIDIYSDKKLLGGTSYNSAVIAKKYGADVSLISAIGNDQGGKMYKKALQEQGIGRSHIQIIPGQTSTVEITLDEHNSPIFGPWNLGALEKWHLSQEDLTFIAQTNIAKAMCLRPIEKNFLTFCNTSMPNTLKVADFDGNSQYSLTPQEIVKYADGLDILVKSLDGEDTKNIELMKKISDEKNKIVLLTLGSKGSLCFAHHQTYTQDALPLLITNTTGFGDAYIAVFLITYFKTKNIQQAMSDATLAIADIPQM